MARGGGSAPELMPPKHLFLHGSVWVTGWDTCPRPISALQSHGGKAQRQGPHILGSQKAPLSAKLPEQDLSWPSRNFPGKEDREKGEQTRPWILKGEAQHHTAATWWRKMLRGRGRWHCSYKAFETKLPKALHVRLRHLAFKFSKQWITLLVAKQNLMHTPRTANKKWYCTALGRGEAFIRNRMHVLALPGGVTPVLRTAGNCTEPERWQDYLHQWEYGERRWM